MKKILCYKKTAIAILGLTSSGFEKLKLKPEKIVKNPHYKASPAFLFDRKKIEKLVGSKKVLKLLPKVKNPINYKPIFERKYSSKESAIYDACDILFNLNRYCKHDSCNAKNRTEIYSLKNNFIKMLYGNGYCENIYEHYSERECYTCNGTGFYYHEDKGIVDCNRCKGTGIYSRSEFVVFEFKVNGELFNWHQPKYLINFDYKCSQPSGKLNPTEIKSVSIPNSKMKEGKELIKWVLGMI